MGVLGHFAVGFPCRSHGRIAVRGAPTRANHALPSPFFSLISTAYYFYDLFSVFLKWTFAALSYASWKRKKPA